MIKVACVQQRVKIHPNEASFVADISKFAEKAAAQGCRLIVFPEGCGAMLVTQYMAKPLVKALATAYGEDRPATGLAGFGSKLLAASLDKITGMQDMSKTFKNEVVKNGDKLLESYMRVFSTLAREYKMYVVAGSNYVPCQETGRIVNASYVFAPDGSCMGKQDKIHLYIEDTHICVGGDEIKVFEADFGRFGVVICYEGMFPEVSRVMAMQGAQALINVSACPGSLIWHKIRAGAWSRCQDNQTFGMHSCLVGKNDISKEYTDEYIGPSAILAPLALTPEYSGVLAETSSLGGDAIIFAEWDFEALEKVRTTGDTKIFQEMRPDVYRKYLPRCYEE